MDKIAISSELAAGLATSALGAGIGAYTADTSSDKTTAEKLRHRLQNAGIGLAAGGLAGYGLSKLDSIKGLAGAAKDQYSKAKGYYEKLKSEYPAKEQEVIDYSNRLGLPSTDWKRQFADKIYKITPQSSDEDKRKSFQLGNLMAIDPFRMDLKDKDPKPSNAFVVGLGGSALGAGIGAIATDTSSDKTVLQKIRHRLRNAGLGFAAGGLAGYGLTSGAESLGFIKNPKVSLPATPATPATAATAAKETTKQVTDRLVEKELIERGIKNESATEAQIAEATENVNNRLKGTPTNYTDLKDKEALAAALQHDAEEKAKLLASLNPFQSRAAGATIGAGVAALGIKPDPNAKPFESKLDQLSKQLDTVRASVSNLPESIKGNPFTEAVHPTLLQSHLSGDLTSAVDINSPRATKAEVIDYLKRNQSLSYDQLHRLVGVQIPPSPSMFSKPKEVQLARQNLQKFHDKFLDRLVRTTTDLHDPILEVAPKTTQAGHLFATTVDEFGNRVPSNVSREQALIDVDEAKAKLQTGAATPEEISKRLGIKPPPKTFGERAGRFGRGARITGRLGAGAAVGSLLPEIPKLFQSIKER